MEIIAKLLKLGNAGMGTAGMLTLAAPFLMQTEKTLTIPYPLVGVFLLFFSLWAQIALRTNPN